MQREMGWTDQHVHTLLIKRAGSSVKNLGSTILKSEFKSKIWLTVHLTWVNYGIEFSGSPLYKKTARGGILVKNSEVGVDLLTLYQ